MQGRLRATVERCIHPTHTRQNHLRPVVTFMLTHHRSAAATLKSIAI